MYRAVFQSAWRALYQCSKRGKKMNKIKPICIPLTQKKQNSSFAQWPPLAYFLFLCHSVLISLTHYVSPHPHLSLRVSCQAVGKRWNCQKWWMTINLLLSPTPLLRDLHSRRLPGMKANLSLYSSCSLTPFFPLSAIYPSIFHASFFPLLLS